MANYDGLTRNTWTGTWSPTSDHPIVLDTEIRGSLRYIGGNSGDRLTDISGQRLQEGMLVYVKNSYVNGSGFTIQGGEYYTYSLGQGESRDPGTGQMPNADSNWEQAQLGGGDPGVLTLSTRDDLEEIQLNVNNSFNVSLRSGIATVQSVSGSPQVGTGTGTVVGIDTLGTSTFNQLNSTNLNVSGISTFQGLGNFRSNLYIGNDDGSGNRTLFIGDNQYFALKSLSGLDSIIEHNSTSDGDLYLLSGRNVFLRTASGEASAYFRENGPVELYHNNFKRFETTATGIDVYGGASISGIVTVGAGTSDKGLESPSYKLSNNNQTIVGTGGTTGEIKQIGGAPFYYDGSAWREFVLSSGTPVTVPADTEWDNVVFRATFDDDFTDAKFGATPVLVTIGSTIVGSPTKIGTGAFRNIGGNGITGVGVSYPYRSDYDFTGSWTIEFWLYHDSFPTNYDSIISQVSLSDSSGDWTLSTLVGASSVFFVWDNENNNTGQRLLFSVASSTYNTTYVDKWHHYALVREGNNGSLHFYADGVESAYTYTNSVIDNDILHINGAGLSFGAGAGNFQINGTTYNPSYCLDAIFDDVRISCGVGTAGQRYTSVGIITTTTFTPPTTALPTTGTLSSYVQPPGDKYGEITLGGSPTWRGTSGVTVSQQSSGNYRVSFASTYTDSNDYYVLSQGMDQGFASYVGIARSTTHVDLTINRQSDDAAVDTGSLAVQIKNHI
jgi:hypothetical protein